MTLILVGAAARFAIEKHGEQKYGDKPYQFHLFDTVYIMRCFAGSKLSQGLLDASWLHDVVEDTETSIDDVRSAFGDYVADIVGAVSYHVAPTRKQRQELTYPKIRATPDAITVKLADRIANVGESVRSLTSVQSAGSFSMYSREWDTFKAELRGRCSGEGVIEAEMWKHLDELFVKGSSIVNGTFLRLANGQVSG